MSLYYVTPVNMNYWFKIFMSCYITPFKIFCEALYKHFWMENKSHDYLTFCISDCHHISDQWLDAWLLNEWHPAHVHDWIFWRVLEKWEVLIQNICEMRNHLKEQIFSYIYVFSYWSQLWSIWLCDNVMMVSWI